MAVDADSFAGIYRTGAIVWAAVAGLALATGHWKAAAGWTVGCALSMGVLRSLEWVVRGAFAPGNATAARRLLKFYLAKVIGVGLLLAGVVAVGGRSFEFIAAFCGGVLLAQAGIVARALGKTIRERAG